MQIRPTEVRLVRLNLGLSQYLDRSFRSAFRWAITSLFDWSLDLDRTLAERKAQRKAKSKSEVIQWHYCWTLQTFIVLLWIRDKMMMAICYLLYRYNICEYSTVTSVSHFGLNFEAPHLEYGFLSIILVLENCKFSFLKVLENPWILCFEPILQQKCLNKWQYFSTVNHYIDPTPKIYKLNFLHCKWRYIVR